MAIIQWYPGHMNKAKRQMSEQLKMCDMVIEIRDARAPQASSNPVLKQLINQKKHLVVLSKKDLADTNETNDWIKHLENGQTRCIAIDMFHDNVIQLIKNEVFDMMKEWLEKQKRRGILKPRSIRVMICGIPNVGKSTLINQIIRKKLTKTANMPGVTRSLQWVKLDKDIDLLDTPGILWPKFENEQIGITLAIIGSITDRILDVVELGRQAMLYLKRYYPELIKERYKVELKEDPMAIFQEIGEKRKIYVQNEVNIKQTIEIFLSEIRTGKLGKITWERRHVDEI